MAIIINIDVMLAKRKMSVTELADKGGMEKLLSQLELPVEARQKNRGGKR
jgi:DNA-binding Xre family transcriptional regulator